MGATNYGKYEWDGLWGTTFYKFSSFFDSYYYCLNLLPLSDLSVRIDSYDLRLLCQVDRVLRDQCLYLDWSVFGCKKFQKVLPNHFWQVFSFLCHFNIDQTFTYFDRPFFRINSNELCLFWKDDLEEGFFTWNHLVLAK